MKRKEWTADMLETLTKNYATMYDMDLARLLNIDYRVLKRKAISMGLQKNPGFERIPYKERGKRISEALKYTPNTGWKKTQFKKGETPYPENCFKKGHNIKEIIGPEREKERIRKSVETCKKLLRLERARALFFLPQKTKYKTHRQSKAKVSQRSYLKKCGYILDEHAGIAYWTSTTTRAYKIEQVKRFYKFKEYDGVE